MTKKWLQLAVATAVLGTGVLATTAFAQAKTTYHITKVHKIARTAYHVTNSKKTLYTWNKTHTKKLRILNQMDDANQKMSWMADEKGTMTHNGKSATYLHIGDEYNADDGYVYAKSMTKGYSKGYQTDAPYFCYYRLDAATEVNLSPSGSATLPKGTVVQGTVSASNGQDALTISAKALSYQLRHQLKISNQQTFKSVKLKSIKATPVKQPVYNTVTHNSFADTKDTNLFAGTPSTGKQAKLFRTTSDGYVELYDNGTAQQQSEALPQGKPVSQKILTTKKSGGVITIGYRHHIKGLKDTAATVAGAAGYQLTIRPAKQTTTVKDVIYDTYQIGGQPFFAYNTDATLPVTAKKVSSKELAQLTKAAQARTYYRTTRKVTLKAPFDAYVSGTLKYKVTLPKGTIVAARPTIQYKKNRQIRSLSVETSRLNRKLLMPGYRHGLWAGADTVTTTVLGAFTKVKRPAYLPKNNSAGDLYLGSSPKTIMTRTKLAKQSVQLTTNGYVEVRQNKVTGRNTEYRAKPQHSIKIRRTTIKGHTRYLYLAKKLKGFKMTKVHYRGKTQYRLALYNPRKTYAIDFDPEGDIDESTPDNYGFLKLGGKTFYTRYALDD